MSNDNRLTSVEKIMQHANEMKASRFWALWLAVIIFAVGFAAPHLLEWVKVLGGV